MRSDRQKEKVSILNEIDFGFELIRRDEVNVAYILNLLAKLYVARPKKREKQCKAISDIKTPDIQLRSKKELSEQLIKENLRLVYNSNYFEDAFETFWTIKKKKAIKQLSEDKNLNFGNLVTTVSNYLFARKEPVRDEVISLMENRT